MLEFLSTLDTAAWFGVVAAFVLAFDRLAKLTPTDADNKIVAGVYKVFAVLGIKVPDRR